MKDIRKLFVPQKMLEAASIASKEARPYEEVEAAAALEVKELPSEKQPAARGLLCLCTLATAAEIL